jgi:hypothetical protein
MPEIHQPYENDVSKLTAPEHGPERFTFTHEQFKEMPEESLTLDTWLWIVERNPEMIGHLGRTNLPEVGKVFKRAAQLDPQVMRF